MLSVLHFHTGSQGQPGPSELDPCNCVSTLSARESVLKHLYECVVYKKGGESRGATFNPLVSKQGQRCLLTLDRKAKPGRDGLSPVSATGSPVSHSHQPGGCTFSVHRRSSLPASRVLESCSWAVLRSPRSATAGGRRPRSQYGTHVFKPELNKEFTT